MADDARAVSAADDVVPEPGTRGEPEVEDVFDRLVAEGRDRLARSLLPLLTTAFVGGLDVGIGVLMYLVVKAQTGSGLLAALAFTVGFVALLMARSELFTENFLVPVTAVVAREGTVVDLLRLGVVSLVANLAGGFVMAGMIVAALPGVRSTAVESGAHYAELGVSWESFFLAVLAGLVITVRSAFGNLVGGLVLVTAVRLLRVPHRVKEERTA